VSTASQLKNIMGKAGEKQKRKPKIKDKRQSERFKETARQIGADQESASFRQLVTEVSKQQAVPRRTKKN
jgi:hypothetical protein